MRSPVRIWVAAPRKNPGISMIPGFFLFVKRSQNTPNLPRFWGA
nr:MAG TPA: hypothetical protein [Caudoviricetes sp.]